MNHWYDDKKCVSGCHRQFWFEGLSGHEAQNGYFSLYTIYYALLFVFIFLITYNIIYLFISWILGYFIGKKII